LFQSSQRLPNSQLKTCVLPFVFTHNDLDIKTEALHVGHSTWEGLVLEVWGMKKWTQWEGTQGGGGGGSRTTSQGLWGRSGLGEGPHAGSSYHVRVILGQEGGQLYLRGRSSRARLSKRHDTSSVNQTRAQTRGLC